ncbi:hypothetical protein QTP86_003945 [Hemibagrus guttatus]|nr:hypothetical protein QTP86_003945 [Hemibagrus guttatus]
MKSGKAVGPDDIPVEVWKCLGEAAVESLTSLFNRVSENLEKAYDRVPREELWYCMRKSGVAEKYVRVVQDMYERSRTVVRCAVGQTEEFKVEVGLHQGSALSPFLFAIVMDQLSEEVRQESPWTMMFADDIVICSESREQVEENLESWRFALERRGMKVSRSKTEYMCVNEREGSGTVRLQGEEVKKVQEFKYLGSTVQSNGECGKEVKKRVQAGWNGWRKVSGVLCDRKISARIKGKVYRTVVRPAMLYGLETVSLRKRQESELEVAELKMLRFSLGVTRLDRIRNEYIRGTAHVGRLGDKVREVRLRWFGHVQRRETVLFVAFLCLDLCTCVSTMPICAYGHTGCQLLSLANLFDRVIQHSARMHGLSSDLYSELHEELTEVILKLLMAWTYPLSLLHENMSHQQDFNSFISSKALEMNNIALELRKGVEKVMEKMQLLGMISNSMNGFTSPEDLFPASDEAMSEYELLYCFRRDSDKVQNYLKILKCRIVPEHGC